MVWLWHARHADCAGRLRSVVNRLRRRSVSVAGAPAVVGAASPSVRALFCLVCWRFRLRRLRLQLAVFARQLRVLFIQLLQLRFVRRRSLHMAAQLARRVEGLRAELAPVALPRHPLQHLGGAA